jgi:hypothetical protein
MFVQTLASFPVTFAERRRASRRRAALETVCRLSEADGESIGCGLVWNVSTTGVSMLLNVTIEPGTWVRAELVGVGGASVRVGLTVVHLNRLRTGDYVLGGQFSRPLDESQLRPFVAGAPLQPR